MTYKQFFPVFLARDQYRGAGSVAPGRRTKQNLASDGPGRKRARCTTVFLTDEKYTGGFFTYHGFVTIASSSRIISLD
jgi:hypothetical protein